MLAGRERQWQGDDTQPAAHSGQRWRRASALHWIPFPALRAAGDDTKGHGLIPAG